MPLLAANYVASVNVAGAQTASELNLSGVVYDLEKDDACPDGVKELEWPREFWANDGSVQRSERTYTLPWSAGPVFYQWAMGYATNVLSPGQGTPAGVISRVIPAQDPKFPWLYCSACELVQGRGAGIDDPDNFATDSGGAVVTRGNPPAPVVPMCVAAVDNRNAGGPAYTEAGSPQGAGSGRFFDGVAVYRLTFTARRGYRVFNDREAGFHPAGEMCRMLRIDYDPSFEGLPLANVWGQLLAFTDGPNTGAPIRESGILIVPGGVACYEWMEVPDPPFDTIDAMRGTVNAATLYAGPGRRPFTPGTALFFQPKLTPWVNAVGRVVWNCTYRFGIRPVKGGWNGFPDPGRAGHPEEAGFNPAAIGADALGHGGRPVYLSADHSQLFKVGRPVDWRGT